MKERVLVTRSSDGGGFGIALAAADFRAVEVPLVEHTWAIDALLAAADGPTPDALVIPSVAAADALALALPQRWRTVPARAIGPATQRRLTLHERPVAFTAESSADLLSRMADLPACRVALLRGDEAGSRLADALARLGNDVIDVVVYGNREPAGAPGAIRSALPVPFTALMSGSAARRLAAIVGPDVSGLGRVAALGGATADAARQAGLEVHAIAVPPNATGLVAALVALRGGAQTR
jgi:uroporphyrinogen-III synthase